MIAIRINRRLDAAIPQLPELTPLIGQRVAIVATAEGASDAVSVGIHRTPGVSGGVACVGNTRVPVWTLIQLQRLGRSEADLLADFPSVSPSDLDAAWSYYRSNAAEIEADIADQAADEREP